MSYAIVLVGTVKDDVIEVMIELLKKITLNLI